MKSTLTKIIYTSILYLLIPLELIRLFWRGRAAPDYRLRWDERFAFFLPKVPKGGIWVHTASVGEFFAALPVIRILLKRYPNIAITVTTMTPTGSEQVIVELGKEVHHFYVPFDLPDVVNRFLKHIEPVKLLIMETELWPNIIFGAHEKQVEIILMNARLSERSARGYSRVRSLTETTLQKISIIAAQHENDAKRFIELGANEETIHITGNIKYDLTIDKNLRLKGRRIREKFESELVWIAASTHRGEDEYILKAHKIIREQFPTAQLIIVPRHPERFDEVAQLCAKDGFTFTRRSLAGETDQAVYLGDTMGELLLLFAVADMAFVGGSLVETGGHNLLEPAILKKPIMTGPHDFNFQDINRQMLASKAAVRVLDSKQLAEQVILWQENPEIKAQAGEAGYSVVMSNQGALKKLLKLIEG